jgi:polar amino acid transport system substrate-binding protein
VLLASHAPALAQTNAASEKPLRVVTVTRPPFSMAGDGTAQTGFAIDLWRAIAAKAQWRYELKVMDTFPAMLDAVRQGQADLAVANISVTAEREAALDFSLAIYDAGLQIMVPEQAAGGGVLAALFGWQILSLVLPALAIIFALGALMWLLERQRHEFFQQPARTGLWESFWWALQRMASGGYEDVSPRTLPGRLLGIAMTIASLFLASAFVATLSSTMTVNQLQSSINSPLDLPGKRVVTTRNSSAAAYLRTHQIAFTEVDSLDAMFAAVEQGRADAAVHDAPILEYHASRAGLGKVHVVGSVFKEEHYGVALAEQSPLREPINRALLALREDGSYLRLRERYFGKKEP